jgi:hypothetical protein
MGPPGAIKRDLGKKADFTAMSNAEILERAIGKANANGWKGSVVYPEVYRSPEQLIYSHDFARALWGEGPADQDMPAMYQWEEHLMRMVIAKDPIAYLAEHM